jgi:hypothetical protein
MPTDRRIINALLAALVLFDLALVVWAFGLPDLWWQLFHTSNDGSVGANLLLKRCGAAWGAFALFQGIALYLWREKPYWLAVVAGIRLSDIFTDPVYAVFSADPSWLNTLSLPLMGVGNVLLGVFFLNAFLEHSERRA